MFSEPAKVVAVFVLIAAVILVAQFSAAATATTQPLVQPRKSPTLDTSKRGRHHSRQSVCGDRVRSRNVSLCRKHRSYDRKGVSSSAGGMAGVDISAGEDPIVRQAAIDALGNIHGSVLAIDPASGRILAMLNQKLARSNGAQPCSTIKLSVALAALSEGIITKETEVRLGGSYHTNLTTALARSNNGYFEVLGRQLGFRKVSHYAHLYGLGELAGYHIAGEQPGSYPKTEITPRRGGVGKMCSFGEGISMTPLQLGSLLTAIANGGTMYYLQHPTTPEEVANFRPIVKRYLDITRLIPEISSGMAGAVEYGTARALLANFGEVKVLGKTGTCSHGGTHFGWFGSYANTVYGRIVIVIFLQGGRAPFGPQAAAIAGRLYRNLYDHAYFAAPSESPGEVYSANQP